MTAGARRDAAVFGASVEGHDDALLRRRVQELVAARGGTVSIDAIVCRPMDEGSSHAATSVNATLAGGESIELFVKDFRSSRYEKDDPRLQALRELRVYRDLLADAELGTAELYGASAPSEESAGPAWIVLERVRGMPLADRGYDDWEPAVRWLARLHDFAARNADRIAACAELARHDERFFRATAERALAAVSAVSRVAAARLRALLRRYERSIRLMIEQSPTLVHGAFKSRHVFLDDSVAPARVCPVDWELAATGSALYDLAFLAYGVRDATLDRLLGVYRAEAVARGLPVEERIRMRRLVNCFRVHCALKSLGRAVERAITEDRVMKRIASAERLADDVEAHGEGGR